MDNKENKIEETEYNPHEIVKCCLCGREIEMWQSANPWPIVDDDDSRCCHDCDANQVLPARWRLMHEKKI